LTDIIIPALSGALAVGELLQTSFLSLGGLALLLEGGNVLSIDDHLGLSLVFLLFGLLEVSLIDVELHSQNGGLHFVFVLA